jgi:hypothetical protein
MEKVAEKMCRLVTEEAAHGCTVEAQSDPSEDVYKITGLAKNSL